MRRRLRHGLAALLLVIAAPALNSATGSADMHARDCTLAGYSAYSDGWCVRENHGATISVSYERATHPRRRHPQVAILGGYGVPAMSKRPLIQTPKE